MPALFVLVHAPAEIDALLASAPSRLQASLARMRCRRYPRADDAEHLLSLVREMRDPVATIWIAGTAKAIVGGAVFGAITSSILAYVFDLTGRLEAAFALGALLGGATATATGGATTRDEVLALLPHVQPGCVLVSWSGSDLDDLRCLRSLCHERNLHTSLRS